MSAIVTIADDPGHAEGGHALVHVQGAARAPATGTLIIEILTEGFDYRGPRRLDVAPLQTENGFTIPIGPEIVGALRQGLAVNLRLDGAGLNLDVLWPALSPPRAVARRSAISNTKRRVVVGDGASQAAQPQVQGTTSVVRPELVDETPPEHLPIVTPPLPKVQAEALVPPVVVKPSADTVTEPKTLPAEGLARGTKATGWPLMRVAAGVLVGFLLGAGSMALLKGFTPAPQPQPIEAKANLEFASPYDLLADLPSRSPDGIMVKASENSLFRNRAQSAASTKEADFWRLWAIHASLESRTNNLAGVLGDFATVMANTHKGEGDIAAARIVWELAAIGRDCNAMDNLAATYSMMGTSDKSAPILVNQKGWDRTSTVTTWHRRADECREHAMSKR